MPSIIVIKQKLKTLEKKRLVIIIGKRVSKKAVRRNKLRRRIRAIMQLAMKNPNKDYTVIVKPGAEDLTYPELKEEIKHQILSTK